MSDISLLLLFLAPVLFSLVRDESEDSERYVRTMIVVCGYAMVLSSRVLLAERQILVSSVIVKISWLIAFLIGMYWVVGSVRRNSIQALKSFATSLVMVFGAVLTWAYPYFKSADIRQGAPFSNANNDLAIYVVSADNFLHSGFNELGRIVGYQAGLLTNFEVAGSASLVSTISQWTGKAVWRSTNLSMLILVSLSSILLYILMRNWKVHRLLAALTCSLAMILPFSRLVQTNYFLSQSISRFCLLLVLVGVILIFRAQNRSHLFVGMCAISSGAWLSLVTYPAGSISSGAVIFGVVVILLGFSIYEKDAKKGVVLFGAVLAAILIPAPLLVSRWSLIRGNVSLYSTPNVTGWKAPTRSFSDWLGTEILQGNVWEFFIGLTISLGLLFVLVLRKRSQKIRDHRFFVECICTTALIGFLYLALSFELGSTSYQVWKFLATVQPIFFVALLSAFWISIQALSESTSRLSKKLVLILPSLILIALLLGNTFGALETYKSKLQIPTMELEEAARNPKVARANLLIRMDPYLETMIAPVILNLRDAIYASDTYLGPSSPNDFRCAISRKSADLEEIALTNNLVLSPAKSCTP